MQDHRTPPSAHGHEPEALERAALAHLLEANPCVFTLAELARELDVPDHLIEDTVAALAACGLVNRWELFVVASRAAVRCHQLDS